MNSSSDSEFSLAAEPLLYESANSPDPAVIGSVTKTSVLSSPSSSDPLSIPTITTAVATAEATPAIATAIPHADLSFSTSPTSSGFSSIPLSTSPSSPPSARSLSQIESRIASHSASSTSTRTRSKSPTHTFTRNYARGFASPPSITSSITTTTSTNTTTTAPISNPLTTGTNAMETAEKNTSTLKVPTLRSTRGSRARSSSVTTPLNEDTMKNIAIKPTSSPLQSPHRTSPNKRRNDPLPNNGDDSYFPNNRNINISSDGSSTLSGSGDVARPEFQPPQQTQQQQAQDTNAKKTVGETESFEADDININGRWRRRDPQIVNGEGNLGTENTKENVDERTVSHLRQNSADLKNSTLKATSNNIELTQTKSQPSKGRNTISGRRARSNSKSVSAVQILGEVTELSLTAPVIQPGSPQKTSCPRLDKFEEAETDDSLQDYNTNSHLDREDQRPFDNKEPLSTDEDFEKQHHWFQQDSKINNIVEHTLSNFQKLENTASSAEPSSFTLPVAPPTTLQQSANDVTKTAPVATSSSPTLNTPTTTTTTPNTTTTTLLKHPDNSEDMQIIFGSGCIDQNSQDIAEISENIESKINDEDHDSVQNRTDIDDEEKFGSLLTFLSEAQVKDLDYIGNVYNNINSIFDLERYLSTLVANESTLNFLVTPPGVATPVVWTFLHIKRLIKELNWLAVAISLDGCGNATVRPGCTTMVRGPPGSPTVMCGSGHSRPHRCSAMDYVWHTLDWAMDTVNIGVIDLDRPLSTVMPALTVRTLTVAFKRLFQIFEHAWYFHERVFIAFENVTNLYQRALAFGLFSKMLTRVPLIPYKLAFKPEEITGLDEESYMKELTYLVQNAHHSMNPHSFSMAHMRAMGM